MMRKFLAVALLLVAPVEGMPSTDAPTEAPRGAGGRAWAGHAKFEGNGLVLSAHRSPEEGEEGEVVETARATGYFSTATGEDTVAAGDYSTATGEMTHANGMHSFTMGLYTQANGKGSLAMGRDTLATADANFAIAAGEDTKAQAQGATALGRGTEANGVHSLAAGMQTRANGEDSVAVGTSTNAAGPNSVAMGFRTLAEGRYSVTMGFGTHARAEQEVAMGQFNAVLPRDETPLTVDCKNLVGKQYWREDDAIVAGLVNPEAGPTQDLKLPDVSDCPEELGGCQCPNPDDALLRVGMGHFYDEFDSLSGEQMIGQGPFERDALRVSAREGNGALHLYAPQVCSINYEVVSNGLKDYRPRPRVTACGDASTTAGRNMVDVQKLLDGLLDRIEALEGRLGI